MGDTGTPPKIPDKFRHHNTLHDGPQWQLKFLFVCAGFLALCFVASLPRLVRAVRTRRAFTGLLGLRATPAQKITEPTDYAPVIQEGKGRSGTAAGSRGYAIVSTSSSLAYWRVPKTGLNVGQLSLVLTYVTTVLYCMIRNADLVANANRAGFMALAQLPVIMLLANKNSLIPLFLGPGIGYEKLNFMHRWAGRTIFIAGAVHGVLWIKSRLKWGRPIWGARKSFTGIVTLAALTLIVLTSLRPVRNRVYQIFFGLHVMLYSTFIMGICYHSHHAAPWVIPTTVLYTLDFAFRLYKYRVKQATLEPTDGQLTLIRVPSLDVNWIAGQHVKLRVFFTKSRVFESHPFTILVAPQGTSCFSSSSPSGGLILGAKVAGDWTKALNNYAQEFSEDGIPPTVSVMLDGPYGGCSVDLGTYETVVLVAGGSGITFTLGLLDDLVGRCVNLGRRGGERTRVVEFIWYIRDFSSFSWFKAMLMDVAQLATDPSSRLDLRCTIFVTRPCEPEDITQMPGLSVLVQKPSATTLLDGVLSWRSSAPSDLESSGASSIFPPSSSAEVDPAATSAEVEGLLSEEGLDNKDSEKDVIVGDRKSVV